MGLVGTDGRPFSGEEEERFSRALLLLLRSLQAGPPDPAVFKPAQLRAWHRALSAAHPRMQPGRYRESDVTFGSFMGAPPAELSTRVRRLARVVRERSGLLVVLDEDAQVEALVRLGAHVHVELVRIHPFWDGNGRLARAAQAWLHWRAGVPAPAFPERRAYLSALAPAVSRGDEEPLLALTLRSLG